MNPTLLKVCLVEHRPDDPREERFRLDMLALLDEHDGAWERNHFVPGHFTASAFALDPAQSRLVMIHHPKLHRWLQPGGHIEPTDATPLDAAARELREETGINLFRPHPAVSGVFDLDIHEIPARGSEPAHLHHDLRFLFTVDEPLLGTPTHEVTRVSWYPLHEVADVGDASVGRAARKIQQLAGRSA